MTQKKRPDLNKILRSILLILGIVLMLLKISARASAEEMASNQQEVIENYLSTELPSSFSSPMISALREHVFPYCNYFGTFYISSPGTIILTFSTDLSVMPVALHSGWGDPPCQVQVGIYKSIGDLGGLISFSESSISNYYGFRLIFYNSTWSLYGIKNYTGSISTKYGDTYFGGGSLTKYAGTSSMNNSNWFNPNIVTWIKSYGYGPVWLACSSDRQYSIQSANNTEPPPSVDSRFSAWTSLDQAGKKLLNITWDSQAYPNTGSYTYQSSTIALQVAVNGQSSTVSFSSTEYPELFVSGNSSYIPYKFIQKLANIATVQDTDTFYLEKITLTQHAYPSAAGSSASQTFKASTVYSLNLGADVVEIPAVPSVTPVPISETNIVETEYFNNIVGGTISSSDSFPIASWANTYKIAIADGEILDSNNELNGVYYDDCITNEELESFLGSISSSDPSLNVNSIVNFETYSLPVYLWDGLHYFNYFHKLVYDNIKDFTDIAIYDLYYPSTTLRKRFIIYTDSYYYKMQLQSLGSLQNMIESNTYYVKALYDYSYIRFNGIAESLESMRISNNNLLSSINANILNLQDLVSSGTDRIVNAISGISPGGGGMSVSDLSGALNTLFMPSFEWDEVNYQDYLDSMGVLALPFEFVFDTQSIIKNNYSASLVMPVNDFSVPLGKDFSDNDIEFTVFEDQEDFTFVPTSIFPAALWSVFQYLAAFALVIGEAWFTYVHIFRKEEKSGDF